MHSCPLDVLEFLDMVASQNLLMVPGVSDKQEVPTEVQEAPFNPRRITLPHRRPQRLGHNIYDTWRPAFFLKGG